MSDSWATNQGTRRSMQANRRRDTAPELAVRKALHAAGLRYRVDFRLAPPLRVHADIVFTRQRIAIFIDGCFWHSCPIHGTSPKAHSEYWGPKLAHNVTRDRENTAKLVAAGWVVLRFWEHEHPEDIVRTICAAVAPYASDPVANDA